MNLKLSLLILSCFACMYVNGILGLRLLTGLKLNVDGLIKADLGLRLGLYLGAGNYRSVLEIPAINNFLLGLRARVAGPIYAEVKAHLEEIGQISSGMYGLGIDRETVDNLVHHIRQLERRRYELEALRRKYFRSQNIDRLFSEAIKN
uniref:BLS2B n=1 Tax=Schmidtea mediterranea TaxID=79327 RepID=A0A6F9EY66_SCHMD|nr:TPA_exp: BLS2B [Schmidtea mediterranea]